MQLDSSKNIRRTSQRSSIQQANRGFQEAKKAGGKCNSLLAFLCCCHSETGIQKQTTSSHIDDTQPSWLVAMKSGSHGSQVSSDGTSMPVSFMGKISVVSSPTIALGHRVASTPTRKHFWFWFSSLLWYVSPENIPLNKPDVWTVHESVIKASF